MNDFPTVCHASYFSPVTQGKLRLLQHKHTGRCYLVFACLLFSGRNVVIFLLFIPGFIFNCDGGWLAARVPPASQCKHCSGLLTQQMATLQPSGAQWNSTIVLLKPIPPYRHTLNANLFFIRWENFCQYRQCEMGRLNTRKLISDTVLILTVLLILKYALLLLNRLFLWHIHLFIFSSIFLCIHLIIYNYK